MENPYQTIISQYSDSSSLVALIEDFNEWVGPEKNLDDFYNFVWNILTAKGWGLDVWGRIVDISRVLPIESGNYLGYEEAGEAAEPFNVAPFWTGTPSSSNYILSDDAYRTLILIKALSNISSCTIPIYNSLMRRLFPDRGNAYVIDVGNMVMRLVFEFLLQPFEISVLKNSNAFSAPTGVGIEYLMVPNPTFGFAEAQATGTFNDGSFLRSFF